MTDTPRGPTTEELRARALAHHGDVPQPDHLVTTDAELVASMLSQTTPLLPRPCLACNREQGERMCDLCQRLELAERSL